MSRMVGPDGYLKVTLKARIPITLSSYPEDVTDLVAAMEYEKASYEEGAYGEEDIISMADSLDTTWEVVP